jgi:hypothetical protein
METQVFLKEDLELILRKVMTIGTFGLNDVVIASVSRENGNNRHSYMYIEVFQKKRIPDCEINLTTVCPKEENLNIYSGIILVRKKFKVTIKEFDYLFYSLTENLAGYELSGSELYEKTKNINNNEILTVFAKIKTIMVDGEIEIPTISIKQYSIKNGLHKNIKKILDIDEVNRTASQIEELNSMILVNKERDCMVDEYGNQVYQLREFTYSDKELKYNDIEGVYLKKIPISEYYDYVFNMSTTLSNQLQSDICKTISSNESMLWTSGLIEKYYDKWDWDELSKNKSIPWSLNLINKYASKLSCSESIWKKLKPYIDDELIEEVLNKIN